MDHIATCTVKYRLHLHLDWTNLSTLSTLKCCSLGNLLLLSLLHSCLSMIPSCIWLDNLDTLMTPFPEMQLGLHHYLATWKLEGWLACSTIFSVAILHWYTIVPETLSDYSVAPPGLWQLSLGSPPPEGYWTHWMCAKVCLKDWHCSYN